LIYLQGNTGFLLKIFLNSLIDFDGSSMIAFDF